MAIQKIARPTLLVCLGSSGRKIGFKVLADLSTRLLEEERGRLLTVLIDLETDRGRVDEFKRNNQVGGLQILSLPLRVNIDNVKEMINIGKGLDFFKLGYAVPDNSGDGAGSMRYRGHAAIWSNLDFLRGKLIPPIKDMLRSNDASQCDVYLTGFLGGGTCSGTLPSVITVLQQIIAQDLGCPDYRFTLHCSLPEIADRPLDYSDVQRDANTMAALLELEGVKIATEGELGFMFSFGEQAYKLAPPFLNEIFLFNDTATNDAEQVNEIIAANLTLRIQSGHGVGDMARTDAEDLVALNSLDNSGTYPFFAATAPIEIVLPVNELAKAYANEHLLEIFDQTYRTIRLGERVDPDLGRYERDDRPPLNLPQQRKENVYYWDDIIKDYRKDAEDWIGGTLETHLVPGLTRITSGADGERIESFSLEFARIFTKVREGTEAYRQLRDYYNPQTPTPPAVPSSQDISARAQKINGMFRSLADREERVLHQHAAALKDWHEKQVVYELYKRAYEKWNDDLEVLKRVHQFFHSLADRYRVEVENEREKGIPLAQPHRYRRSIFDTDTNPQHRPIYTESDVRTLQPRIAAVRESLRNDVVKNLSVAGSWLPQAINVVRYAEPGKAQSAFDYFVRSNLLGDIDESTGWLPSTGWIAAARDNLGNISLLTVIGQICKDDARLRDLLLDRYITWMCQRADDHIRLVKLVPADPIENRLKSQAFLAAYWNGPAEEQMLKTMAHNRQVGSMTMINAELQIADQRSEDKHRLVMLYTVHGIGVLDLSNMFRPNARFCHNLYKLDEEWIKGGMTARVKGVFTCTALRNLVINNGSEGVWQRLVTAWQRKDTQIVY